MGLGLYLVGVPRHPLPAGQIETWLRTRCSGELENINTGRYDQGEQININLHPAAEDVGVIWRTDSVLVSARTSPVGPGYHLYICDLFLEMGRKFDIQWLPPTGEDDVADDASDDEGGFFFTGDR